MIKVKILQSDNERDLEKEINGILYDIEEHEYIDIKYSSNVATDDDYTVYTYSAMIIYKF